MREARNKSVREEIRQTTRNSIAKALKAQVTDANKAQGAQAAKAGPLVKPGRDVPQTVQKGRADTQNQAANEGAKASSEFLKAKSDASGLKALAEAPPKTASGRQAATTTAVTNKGEAGRPDFGQQQANQALAHRAAKTSEAAGLGQARQTAATHLAAARKGAKVKQGEANLPKDVREVAKNARAVADPRLLANAQKGAQPVPLGPGATQAKGDRGEVSDKSREDGGKKRAEKKGGESGRAGGVYAGKSDAGRGLDALASGLGSSGGEAGSDAGAFAQGIEGVGPQKGPGLPEKDPTFYVYSEFDEEVTGVEVVKSKAQLFSRYVEQRLQEIAQFDYKLGLEIRGLSERIVGDCDGLITTADFLKTVYG